MNRWLLGLLLLWVAPASADDSVTQTAADLLLQTSMMRCWVPPSSQIVRTQVTIGGGGVWSRFDPAKSTNTWGQRGAIMDALSRCQPFSVAPGRYNVVLGLNTNDGSTSASAGVNAPPPVLAQAATPPVPAPAPSLSFENPVSYCKHYVDVDKPGKKYTGPATLSGMAQALDVDLADPDILWRCMGGKVYVCLRKAEAGFSCAKQTSGDVDARGFALRSGWKPLEATEAQAEIQIAADKERLKGNTGAGAGTRAPSVVSAAIGQTEAANADVTNLPAPTAAETSGNDCNIKNDRDLASLGAVSWTGPCVDGYASGKGTATWYRDGIVAFQQEYTGDNGLLRIKGDATVVPEVIDSKIKLLLENCEAHAGARVRVDVDSSLDLSTWASLSYILEIRAQEFGWNKCQSVDLLYEKPIYNMTIRVFRKYGDAPAVEVRSEAKTAGDPTAPHATKWVDYSNADFTKKVMQYDEARKQVLEQRAATAAQVAAQQARAAAVEAQAAAEARVAAAAPPPTRQDAPWSISGIALGMETQDAIDAARDIIVSDFGPSGFKVDVGGMAEGLFSAVQQYPCSRAAQAAMNNGKPHDALVTQICFLQRYLEDPGVTNQSLWISTVEDPSSHQSVIAQVVLSLGVFKEVNWDGVLSQLISKYGEPTSTFRDSDHGDCSIWGEANAAYLTACSEGHKIDLADRRLSAAAIAEWKRQSLDTPVLR